MTKADVARRVALAAALMATGAAPSARAASPAPSAPLTVATLAESLPPEAKSDYAAGRVLFDDGDFAGALVKFRRAHEEAHDARLLWNMAACEKNLRHYARALDLVRRFRQEGGERVTEQERKEGLALEQTLAPFTASLELRASEAGASVYVDDGLVGTTPLPEPLVVDMGLRKIRVTKPGMVDFVTTETVDGGTHRVLEAKLSPVVHEGRYQIVAGQGDTIALDGRVVAVGRYEGPLPSGGHRLTVTAKGMRSYESELVVEDGVARSLHVKLEPDGSKGPVPTWAWLAGGAVVVAGAVVGGYFLAQPSKAADVPRGNFGSGLAEASMRGGFR